MYDLLSGLTVIEGSAFVAALGGMTLAQLGANVIRLTLSAEAWISNAGL